MLLHGLAERAEDYSLVSQLLTEGRSHRNRVKHGIDGSHARQDLPLFQRNAELVEGLGQLRVNLLRPVSILLRGCVIYNILIVNMRHIQVTPFRGLHRLPFPECVETEVQKPLRLPLPLGNHPDNVLVQAFRDKFLLDIGDKTLLVFLGGYVPEQFLFFVYIHKYLYSLHQVGEDDCRHRFHYRRGPESEAGVVSARD